MTSPAIMTARSVIGEVLGALEKQPISLLVPFDTAAPSAAAQAAFARMGADTRDYAALANQLVATYGFDSAEGLRGRSIRDPRVGLDFVDMAAVLAVADALGERPEEVLTLWIIEGKDVHNTLLRGGPTTFELPAAATSDALRVRSLARSVVFFRAFGSDKFTAHTERTGPDGDNELQGPDGDHDGAFRGQLRRLRAAGVHGLADRTDAEITRSFRDVGGALQVQVAPSGDPRVVTARIAPNALASWLYLQNGLFAVFAREAESFFLREHGTGLTLDGRPWVTYVAWNGGLGAMRKFFDPKAFDSAEAAISSRFGDSTVPAPMKLDSDQLDRYYARGQFGNRTQSSAALANALTFLHVHAIVADWFV